MLPIVPAKPLTKKAQELQDKRVNLMTSLTHLQRHIGQLEQQRKLINDQLFPLKEERARLKRSLRATQKALYIAENPL